MPTTSDTADFLRFERVDSVAERGVLAELHGERLRLDVIRDDLVRIKISRAGSSTRRRTSPTAPTRSRSAALSASSAAKQSLGVRVFGCTYAQRRGIRPSRHMAKKI